MPGAGQPFWDEFRFEFYAWLIILGGCALVVAVWWLGWGRHGQGLLPTRRVWAVPWSFLEVALAGLLAIILWGVVVYAVLVWVYLLLRTTGVLSGASDGQPPTPPSSSGMDAIPKPIVQELGLWAEALAVPLKIISIPFLLHRLSGTWPYQLGLTIRRWWPNIVLGCLGWFVLTPCVYAIEVPTNWFYVHLGLKTEEHPLVERLLQNPQAEIWALAAFLTVVGAPLWEELLFRGVVLRWVCFGRWRSEGAMFLAVIIGVWVGWDKPQTGALWFVVAMLALFLVLPYFRWPGLGQLQAAQGILATAVLFGLSHSFAWPSPIPLTALGVGLGWLAYRTQSLVAPMVVHGLFNAVTMVALALQAGG